MTLALKSKKYYISFYSGPVYIGAMLFFDDKYQIKNGQGTFKYKTGNIEKGSYENGWRHGEWLVLDKDGNKVRTETWKNGELIKEQKYNE